MSNSGVSGSSGSISGANYGFGVGLAGGASTAVAHQGQGVAALLVMIAVLCFMFAYCCWGAPFCRSLCRRHCYSAYCCCCCGVGGGASGNRSEDGLSTEDGESGGFGSATNGLAEHAMITTPTIILLPHGRTFVVHGRIFTQFQADNTGLDLVELGESVMRAQRGASALGAGGSTRHSNNNNNNNQHHYNHHRQHHHHHSHRRQLQLQDSQGSIIEMDADTPSKDSMGSLGCFPPPTYESIYGKEEEEGDLPPSYSDILLHRFANLPFELEMQQQDSKDELVVGHPRIINNPIAGNFGHRYPAPNNGYSSRSLPRRNPSLISNPLDGYYIDNELASLHNRGAIGQRRRSAAADVTSRTTMGGNDDEAASNDDSRTNSDDLVVAVENVLDNRFASSRGQSSRSQNDLMNSRNIARSESSADLPPSSCLGREIDARQRGASEERIDRDVDVHRLGRITREPVNWNASEPDVRYVDEEDEDNEDAEGNGDFDSRGLQIREVEGRVENDLEQDEEDEEDEIEASGNFQALADIRESRV